MRTYKNLTFDNDSTLIRVMQSLSKPNITVQDYRESFYVIGRALGEKLNAQTHGHYGNAMLACAFEDADWLARGVLETIASKKTSLAVFWSGERITIDERLGMELSPIEKTYIEPIEKCQTLILVKSIISTSCVVKTQLTHLVNKVNPQIIYVVSPVMYKDAERNLRKEFPSSISERFRFLTFAIDTVKTPNGIVPGVGGMVYPKLGLGDLLQKNKYLPELIKSRVNKPY